MNVRSVSTRVARAVLRGLSPGGADLLYRRPKAEAADFLKFPCQAPRISRLEEWLIAHRGGRMTCTVCGGFTRFRIEHDNLRETCSCEGCGATNRHRQIAYILCAAMTQVHRKPIHALPTLTETLREIAIYNTEARGPAHTILSSLSNYQASEYFGPEHQGGLRIRGVLHQDLQHLTFPDGAFDIVLSSDVFEHIPDPYQAHAEVLRVLKPGGRHIFTVPFHGDGHLDETRARLGPSGIDYILPPIYHHDPQTGRNDVLVYTIFGLEMLVRLSKVGFHTAMYQLSAPWLGILGTNALVFEARKR